MTEQKPPFRLLWHFSIVAVLGIVAAVLLLGLGYYRITKERILAVAEANNMALTNMIANALSPGIAELIEATRGLSADALRARPDIAALHQTVEAQVDRVPVVKVKIYSPEGMVVFSTEARQIGENHGADPEFQRAVTGRVTSEHTSPEAFNVFDRETVHGRKLLSSYVPIRQHPDGKPTAVFEVYSDVTRSLAGLDETLLTILALTTGVLALLYPLMFVVVRRAHGVISRQAAKQRELQSRIFYLADYDEVTGLPNRRMLVRHLNGAIARANDARASLGVIVVAVEQAKKLEDTALPEAEDEFVLKASQAVKTVVGQAHFLARYSESRLVCVVEDIRKAHEAFSVARFIVNACGRSDCEEAAPTEVHVGISMYPRNGVTCEGLLQSAVAAASSARCAGPNRIRFHRDGGPWVVIPGTAQYEDLQAMAG